MTDLGFLASDLQLLVTYFAELPDASASDWHITHNTFHRTNTTRTEVEAALEKHGLFTSYIDETDDADFPHWLDMMEPVAADAGAVRERIARVVDVVTAAGSEYNSFTLIGSRGESFPS